MENEITPLEEIKERKLANASFTITNNGYTVNIWSPDDIDKLEIVDLKKFTKVVNDVRFYYERDPIASTVINKMVEIGITRIVFDQNDLSNNEFRAFQGVQPALHEFAEDCALEYLLSGLVVPEIAYTAVNKDQLFAMGVKKYTSLVLPTSMWLRDPTTITINTSMMSKEPSYFVEVPQQLIMFIKTQGTYPDGTKDPALYEQLATEFPAFVAQVLAGATKVLLDNPLIVRRKVTTRCPYPVPYLYASLEALKHKRNLRRMDYSIASRVISAIQVFQLGNDNFPITEDDAGAFESLREQMAWRNTAGRDMERIFQLFANHTLKITWVAPDTTALLNEAKYAEVNQDIFMGLGFPKILVTGETVRTQTSNPEMATLSPIKTMENMQRKILKIVKGIVEQITIRNGFKSVPEVRFDRINMHSFVDFVNGMKILYDTGNISRETFDEAFGYNYADEFEIRQEENQKLEATNTTPFNQQPFTAQPGSNLQGDKTQNQNVQNQTNTTNQNKNN